MTTFENKDMLRGSTFIVLVKHLKKQKQVHAVNVVNTVILTIARLRTLSNEHCMCFPQYIYPLNLQYTIVRAFISTANCQPKDENVVWNFHYAIGYTLQLEDRRVSPIYMSCFEWLIQIASPGEIPMKT